MCVKVGHSTAVDVYQWLREVCSTRFINDLPAVLGSPGVVAQVDKSLFKYKPKVPDYTHSNNTNAHVLLSITEEGMGQP